MDERVVKVIHMAPLGAGGISKLTISIHRLMNPDKIHFDYLVFRDRKEFLEDEAIRLGGRKQIVNTENEHNKILKCVKKINQMKKLFKREQYDVVHVDASTPYDVIVAIAAKMAGVKTIILHSHNDGFQKVVPLRDAFMDVYKQLMLYTVTDYFAISESAAEFMFPKKIIESKNYRMIHNGIDVNEFLYSKDDRQKARKVEGLDGKLVIGHIGRFVYQKNHEFIIDVFENISKKEPNAVLLLVGEGELQENIKELVKQKGLSSKVVFYGATHDVRKTLLMMDAFIFPSRFEGLGIVALEAQTNGLPVYAADSIVEEVNVTDRFKRISGWDAKQWAEEMLKDIELNKAKRHSYDKELIKAGYSIKEVAQELEKFYLSCAK